MSLVFSLQGGPCGRLYETYLICDEGQEIKCGYCNGILEKIKKHFD